jgi:hypothetical protein
MAAQDELNAAKLRITKLEKAVADLLTAFRNLKNAQLIEKRKNHER